jgi:hypothetical protein
MHCFRWPTSQVELRIMPLRTLALVSHSMAGRTEAPLWVRIPAAPPASPLTFSPGVDTLRAAPIQGPFRAQNHHHAAHKSAQKPTSLGAFGAFSPGRNWRVVVFDAPHKMLAGLQRAMLLEAVTIRSHVA